MTGQIVVFSTCASAEEAARLARGLVEARLAACVSVSREIRSYYHWQGAVEESGEFLLVIKTSRDAFDALRRWIEKEHPYEIPELIALPILDGAPNYLNWLRESVAPPAPGPAPGA
jgi:periplasmic divalent cation tolerance protein